MATAVPFQPEPSTDDLVRPHRRTVSIVPPRAFERREALEQVIVPPLADAILEIARAAQDLRTEPGDSSFCILDARLADGATYLQYLADPGQPELLWEVASGEWSAHQHVLTPQEAAKLAALGFTMRDMPGNARRSAVITSRGDAEEVARQSVAVLLDVLGFDGRGPVTLQIVHDASSRRSGPALTTLAAVTDVAALLQQAGDPTAVAWQGGALGQAHGHPFVVQKQDTPCAGPYERLCFATTWPRALPENAVARLENDFRGCRLRNEPDGRLSLRMDVLLRVGAPIAQLAAWLEEWRRAVGIVARGGQPATVS